ncbi:MAG: thermonuclease family protein [Actinomycetota bacterium]|nr:thermonuclease family protein [Actinomycetota bacterium]
MRTRLTPTCAVSAAFMVVALTACSAPRGPNSQQQFQSRSPTSTADSLGAGSLGTEDTSIVRVVDGDTVIVAPKVRVRLIGINSPESVDPRREVQCFGVEASNAMKQILPQGTKVHLVFDLDRFDRYNRTLAYIYRQSDQMFVNKEMVLRGFAQAYTVPPNISHVEEFLAAQASARRENAGLWSAC